MSENEDKVDCFAYRHVPIKGGGSKARCEALNKLYCRKESCSFYKPAEKLREENK